MAAEQLLVELVLDTSKVESGLDQLTKSGAIDGQMAASFKATNAELNKVATTLGEVSSDLRDFTSLFTGIKKGAKEAGDSIKPIRKNIDDVVKGAKGLSDSFLEGFTEGLLATLEEAGVGLDEFKKSLEDAGFSFGSFGDEAEDVDSKMVPLKKQLRDITLQLQQLELAGEDGSAQYQDLAEKAGKLRDAIRGVSDTINKIGDGEIAIRAIGEAAQGVVGGFAVAQGAMGLFGAESEELQKTLLKVNSAMAILQGLQQLSAIAQKESNLALGISVIQGRIKNAQLALEGALESKNVIVKGAATVAQYALNAAMAANPIGLVVVAIAGIIAALTAYIRITGTAAARTGALNAALAASNEGFEQSASNIRKVNEMAIADLENQGVKQSQILQNNANIEQAINKRRIEELESTRKALKKFREDGGDVDSDEYKKGLETVTKLEQEAFEARIQANTDAINIKKQLRQEDLQNAVANAESELLLAKEGSKAQLNAQREVIRTRLALELNAEGLVDAEKQRLQDQANRDRIEADTAYNKRRLDAQAAAIENELITVREGTEEEYMLRRRLLETQNKAELQNTKLSITERNNIIEKGNQDRALLDRNYSEAQRRLAIENEISKNNAVLSLLKTNDEDRLNLIEDNIEYAAQLEIDAALGNASKIEEITKKRDADILATKKQFLEEAVEYEIALQTANDGPLKRGLERQVANDRASFASRRNAIQQLTELETDQIDKRMRTLDEEYQQRLISDKEYGLRYSELLDQRAAATENGEKQITDSMRAENELRTQIIFDAINQTNAIIGQINQLQTDADAQRISDQRKKLEELKNAGAITEKDAIARAKRIDAEERKLKTQAAQRDKALAVFNAVIATAQAVANSLKVGLPYGAILAGIAAGLGAAQVALIASKPIPRFNAGKKNSYEGLAEVGEKAPEYIQRNGQLYLAKKPTITYIGRNDKVYNPAETRRMMQAGQKVDQRAMGYMPAGRDRIDYDKLGAAVAKSLKDMPTTNISLDRNGFNISVQQGLNDLNYWGNRYSS